MKSTVLILSLGIIFNDVISQTLDAILSSQEPVVIQNLSTTSSKWDELMPALKTLKGNSNIKKEKLQNVAKIIKFLLTEEDEKKNEPKVQESPSDEVPIVIMPDFDSIVEERLKTINDVIEDRNYMLDEPVPEVKNETLVTEKNKTADLGRILSKITTALAKLKEQNVPTEETPTMVPIFRPTGNCQNDFDGSRLLRSSSQPGMNSKSSLSTFSIPCQRASDILEETANFPLPLEALCDNSAVNLKSLAKNAKVNLDNLPFNNIVPNSVTCVDSDDSIAILFKPKTISLMQCFGNLLKKITLTVLVPYYVSKVAL